MTTLITAAKKTREWGVSEFSWQHLFKLDNATLRDVTALSTVSPTQ